MNNTNTRKTCKRLIALFFALTAALSVLSLPVSAKSASGFQYYLTESYEDDEPDFAVITDPRYDRRTQGTDDCCRRVFRPQGHPQSCSFERMDHDR